MNKKKKGISPYRIVILLVLVGVVVLAAIEWRGKNGEKSPVKTAPVKRGDMEVWISATGTVQPRRQVEVKSKAGGEVASIVVEEGDRVEEGDLLINIDPQQEEANLRKAKAEYRAVRSKLSQARTSRKLANKQIERGMELDDDGFIARQDLDRLKADATIAAGAERSARAELALAAENLALAKELLADTEITAPMSGIVLKKYIEVGQIISGGLNTVSGGTALLLIADIASPVIVAQVDESDVGSIKVGGQAKIEVDAYPGTQFNGVIEHIAPMGSVTSNITGFEVRVKLEDSEKINLLKPGMTTKVEILSRKLKDALLVPAAAIRNHKGKVGVWLIAKGEPVFKPLEMGVTDGFTVEVVGGLEEGERVVTGRTPGAEGMPRGRRNIFGCKDSQKRGSH